MRSTPLVRAGVATSLVVSAALLTGCGQETLPVTNDNPEATSYVFSQIADITEGGQIRTLSEPENLADALPNSFYMLPGSQRAFPASDLVVSGTVEGTPTGVARRATGEDSYEPVEFDDPSADERAVDVTISVKEVLAGEWAEKSLTFRVGLVGADDPLLFLEGLASMGDIVAVLDRNTESDRSKDDAQFIPLMSGGLLGQVSEDGSFRFPGLGDREKAFMAGLDTANELTLQADKFTPLPR